MEENRRKEGGGRGGGRREGGRREGGGEREGGWEEGVREEREELTIRCLHESTSVVACERSTHHRRILCSLHCLEQRHSTTI